MRCPGQDPQHWKPDDVFEVPCPACGARAEFFKDDGTRKCRKCGRVLRNPRLDLGCAEWCPYAEKCLAETNPELLKTIVRLERGGQTPRRRKP